MSDQRLGGIIQIKANGALYDAKGAFTYNLGAPKREAVTGSDRVHGFAEKPQVPYIDGAITDRRTLDVEALVHMEDATVTVELANGKVIVLRSAWWAGDGEVSTEEGEIKARWEGMSAEEIK